MRPLSTPQTTDSFLQARGGEHDGLEALAGLEEERAGVHAVGECGNGISGVRGSARVCLGVGEGVGV